MHHDETSAFPCYVGSVVPNTEFHHGQIRPVVGAQAYGVLRANRSHPEAAEYTGWTYNHAPMLAYWRDKFYLEYLSTPLAEHVAPGQTLLTTSPDGRNWSRPRVVFPPYALEQEGAAKAECPPISHAIMHQRMGFYVAKDGRLLILGFYGVSPRPDVLPFDRNGIGRVVREIYPDDTLSPIYFIRYNRHAGWHEGNTRYPFYREAEDPGFVRACDELLANRLVVQQWAEEAGDDDPLIMVKGGYKAFCYYHLHDGKVVGLWKWSKVAISTDEGATWSEVQEAPSLRMSGGKIWGQRTSDGRYALCYNPTPDNKHRWPLAVVTGDDGIRYDEMLLAAGEVPPRRYVGGAYKDYGLNYVRGIAEGNGTPPDGAMWIAYSVNKEDIWVTRISVPIVGRETSDVVESFEDTPAGGVPERWNVYSPVWARVVVTDVPHAGDRSLELRDEDPYDYAKAERVFPETTILDLQTRVMAKQCSGGTLYVEITDARGSVPVRLVFDGDGVLRLHHGRRLTDLLRYTPDTWYDLRFNVDVRTHRFQIYVNGQEFSRSQSYQGQSMDVEGWYFRCPVSSVERIVFRTGPPRRQPDLDTPTVAGQDLPDSGVPTTPAIFYINSLTTRSGS